jgi:uncharacterized protein (TIGR02996 family)
MPFTEEQPFLDAIHARCHEDGPRLVYADFLDEKGDSERAELIRLQLAMARMTEEHPLRPELANRILELRTSNTSRWSEHLADLVISADFRRGLLDSVVMETEAFLASGEELFQRARIRRVSLRNASVRLADLVNCPALLHVRELDLCANDLGNGGVNLLVRSRHLWELQSLDLGFNGIDDAGMNALARASCFPNLGSLSVNFNSHITSAGLAALASSPFLGGLTNLDVCSNDIGEEGIRALLASKYLKQLNTVRLGENPIGDGGAILLAQSALLVRMIARVPRLEIHKSEIGAAGAAALASSPAMNRCSTLDLTGNEIGDAGFEAIVASRNLPLLRVLKVAGNLISDAGIAASRPALSTLMERLLVLDLSDNKLTRYGIGLLETARNNQAVRIDLSRNGAVSGENPVPVGDVLPDVFRGVAEATELRRRVSHPTMRAGERPNPNG